MLSQIHVLYELDRFGNTFARRVGYNVKYIVLEALNSTALIIMRKNAGKIHHADIFP